MKRLLRRQAELTNSELVNDIKQCDFSKLNGVVRDIEYDAKLFKEMHEDENLTLDDFIKNILDDNDQVFYDALAEVYDQDNDEELENKLRLLNSDNKIDILEYIIGTAHSDIIDDFAA